MTIEAGSKVKVTVDGEYVTPGASGHYIKCGGETVFLPKKAAAKVTVTEPPLPREPSVRSFVRVAYGDRVYQRKTHGWVDLTNSNGRAYSWRELNEREGQANLIRLVSDPTRVIATDIAKEPATFHGVNSGRLVVQATGSDSDVKFMLSIGDSVTIPHYAARVLAAAIYKATGGLA